MKSKFLKNRFACISLVVLACAVGRLAVADKKPVFVNYDDTHFLCSRSSQEKFEESDVRQMVRQYRGSDVTDMLFCIGGRIADITNSVKMCWLDKYDQTRENGRCVCYKTNRVVGTAKRVQRDFGLDMYALWIEEARAAAIRPWLSFRMNDCHHTFQPTSYLHSDFYHAHPEYRRIRHRKAKGYFDRCLDYSIAAVRERELKFIAEMLGRYDVDGIEIDWMREPYCFVPGREDTAVITEFMRRVRALADSAAERRGHAVGVAARVPADPRIALEMGFDAAEWAAEGLVDVLSPSPRWRTTDVNLPVALWKRLLRGTKTKLLPGVELLTACSWNQPLLRQTKAQLYGNLHAIYDGGADGLYFFNYFDDPGYATSPYFKSDLQRSEDMAVYHPTQMAILREVGTPANVAAADRDHMLTFEDLTPDWRECRPALPARMSARGPKFFRVVTGSVSASSKVYLRLGIVGAGAKAADVFVNGRPGVYLRSEPCGSAFTNAPLQVYSVTGLVERAAVVEVIPAAGRANLSYLDIQVRPN